MNITLNCPEIGCYTNFQCDTDYKGRIISAAMVKKSVATLIDKTDPTAFLDSLFYQALEGNAILFLNIAGEKPKPETAELPGVGMRINRPGAKTHTLTYVDAQVVGNVDFYNKILRASQNFDFYYFTPEVVWDASGTQVTVIGDPVIQNDLTQFINGETTVKWVADNNPLPEQFDTETLLTGLFYEISGNESVAGEVGTSQTETYTAALNYDFGSQTLPSLVWSVEGAAADLASLNGSMNPTTGAYTFSPTEAGTFDITVKVTNAAGCIFGTLNISVTVTA